MTTTIMTTTTTTTTMMMMMMMMMSGRAALSTAEEWRRAYGAWQRAVEKRDRLAGRTERRIRKATGGLSVARFEVLCRRRRVYTVEDAKRYARAARARPAVETAVAERDRLLADADVKVRAARIALAHASKAVAAYGRTGAAMIRRRATELRCFARLPST
ncbi:MAG: hypothetical protein M0Z40_07620 [Actinomycetota bacterium]|nr:hypothetical protein [Actinomycetota bacterium]